MDLKMKGKMEETEDVEMMEKIEEIKSVKIEKMDVRMKSIVEDTVLEILETSPMNEMTEPKVRKLAEEKLGIVVYEPSRNKFVHNIVESFLTFKKRAQPQRNDAVRYPLEQQAQQQQDDGKEYDENGNLIVCRLSEKRGVTIRQFRGEKLVSVRRFFEEHGLPTSRGISLRAEEWASLKNVPAIDEALKKME